jgi:hypothetical protein
LDKGDGDVASLHGALLNNHGRDWQDQPIVPQLGQPKQQFVVDRQAGAAAVVFDTNEEHTWSTVIRHVVRERTDRFLRLLGIRQGSLALDPIRFRVQQFLELGVGQQRVSNPIMGSSHLEPRRGAHDSPALASPALDGGLLTALLARR